jgi:hypothetical protein
MSLRVRLVLVVLLAVLPALGVILYAASEQREQAVLEAQGRALSLARAAAEEQEQVIEGAHQLLVGLAELPSVRGHRAAECSSLFAAILKRFPRYTSLAAAKPNGEVFCSGLLTRPAAVNLADRLYFRRVLTTHGFAVSEYLRRRHRISERI